MKLVLTMAALLVALLSGLAIMFLDAGDDWSLAPSPTDSRTAATRSPAAPTIEVVAPEAPSSEREVVLDVPRSSSAIRTTSEAPTVTLFGAVRPAQGRDALTGLVKLTVQVGREARSIWHTAADGSFSIEGLPPGRCWIGASSIQDGEAGAALDLDPAQRRQRIDLQLVLPWRVVVRLLDESGAAVESSGWTAIATSTSPGPWLEPFAVTEPRFGCGEFTRSTAHLAAPPAGAIGVLRIDASDAVFVSLARRECVLDSRRVEPGESEVTFVLPSAHPLRGRSSLRLTPVDAATGRPLSAARAEVCTRPFVESLERDGDELVLREVGVGWVELVVSAEGFARSERCVRIAPGVEMNLGEIALVAPIEIAGRVQIDSSPAAALLLAFDRASPPFVTAQSLDGERGASSRGVTVKVADDGSFRFTDLAPARYSISVASHRLSMRAGPVVVDASAGSVSGVELVYEVTSTLTLTPPLERWSATTVQVLDSAGQLVLSLRFGSGLPESLELIAGNYELVVSIGDDATRRMPLTLAGTLVDVDLGRR